VGLLDERQVPLDEALLLRRPWTAQLAGGGTRRFDEILGRERM
jgi:hypothetical protein